MWDIEILKVLENGHYIVMTPNGDTHCINEETLQVFIKNERLKTSE